MAPKHYTGGKIASNGGTHPIDNKNPLSSSPTKEQKRKEFSANVSRMDQSDHRSGVRSSEFRGMYNLAILCGAVYTVTTGINKFLSRGLVYNCELFFSTFASRGFVELISTCLIQALFSCTALIPVALFSYNDDKAKLLVLSILQHMLQGSLFVGTVLCIYIRDWNVIHSVSAFMECIVLLMKMHSYIRSQWDYARSSETACKVSISEFGWYLMFPTLVYEPSYPRSDRVRWAYVFEKFVAIIVAMSMLYFNVTDHILPALERSAAANFVHLTLELLIPFMGGYILIWFIVFECICNGIAEVTRFADRDFYGDWWNSTTFDEYARRWNRPVHEFLRRHVYLSTISTYSTSKQQASTVTFFVSALLHECLFVVMFRTIRLYFFAVQMLQVPLIIFGRGMKGTRLGNFVFWLGLMLGPPMQAVLYCREYFGGESLFFVAMLPMMALSVIFYAGMSLLLKADVEHINKSK